MASLGLTDVQWEHGSERGSCLAVNPLKRIHQDVVVGEACIYKQLGGMSVEWRALVAPQMQEPAFFCARGCECDTSLPPNFLTPIALDISVSTRTLVSFTSSLCIVHAINHRRAVEYGAWSGRLGYDAWGGAGNRRDVDAGR